MIRTAAGIEFLAEAPIVIVGGGAAGLIAALAARDGDADAIVLERDAVPMGSTALSSGFIPAAGTRFQKARGIADSPALMAADVLAKNKNEADPAHVQAICAASGPAIDWLAEAHGIPFSLLDGFLYPGHSVLRMHATPKRSGAELMDLLRGAAQTAGVEIVTSARVTALYADNDSTVRGVEITRPDGSSELIGCRTLILACNGFGGAEAMVTQYIPEMAQALFFGHIGNQGDGIRWGQALGGATRHLGAYQGHGSVATPHNILITWAVMMEGGIQVNTKGKRFSNEHQGYSEQAVAVLAQPGGVAWNIFDGARHEMAMGFPDYREAVTEGAIRSAPSAAGLAEILGLPAAALEQTIAATQQFAAGAAHDAFGRDFRGKPPLRAPFYGAKVTGALFHTQGGLVVDGQARVRRDDGTTLPNLYAAGGTACGVSGAHVWGYLSGNGLLAATTLGRLAGADAARRVGALP
jgi:fumarate reductase flavoprotein subunit